MLRNHIASGLAQRLVAEVQHKDILAFHTGLHDMPTVANSAAHILIKMSDITDA